MKKDKLKNIGLWALQILIALNFIGASIPKLTSQAGIVNNFERWGYPDGFYIIIGIVELLAALLLVIPKTAGYAAITLMGVMLGALVTHLMHGEFTNAIVPVVLSVLLALILAGRFPSALGSLFKHETKH